MKIINRKLIHVFAKDEKEIEKYLKKQLNL